MVFEALRGPERVSDTSSSAGLFPGMLCHLSHIQIDGFSIQFLPRSLVEHAKLMLEVCGEGSAKHNPPRFMSVRVPSGPLRRRLMFIPKPMGFGIACSYWKPSVWAASASNIPRRI